MDCLRCHTELLGDGTGKRFANGIMCSECFPESQREYFREHVSGGTITYSYASRDENGVLHNQNNRYVIVDAVHSNDVFSNAQDVYVLNQSMIEDISLPDLSYLTVPPTTILKNCSIESGRIIARGNLQMYDCNAYIIQVNQQSEIALTRCMVSYIKSFNDSTIDVILDTPYRIPNFYNCRVSNITFHNMNSSFSIDVGATLETIHLINCRLPELKIYNVVRGISLLDCSIDELTSVNDINCLIAHRSYVKINDFSFGEVQNIASRIEVMPVTVCTLCGNVVRRNTNSTIIKGFTIHADCMARDFHSYSAFKTLGNSTRLPTFGFELELHTTRPSSSEYQELLFDLISNGFVRTSDSTVTDEMKSPILRSDAWILQIQEPLELAAKRYVDSDCGTHLHIGANRGMLQFYRNRVGVFDAITEKMYDDSKTTEAIWGRFFNDWAKYSINAADRYSWINLDTGHTTIEYRLPQIYSVKQYRRLIWFLRLLTLRMHQLWNDEGGNVFVHNSNIEKSIADFYSRFLDTIKEK